MYIITVQLVVVIFGDDDDDDDDEMITATPVEAAGFNITGFAYFVLIFILGCVVASAGFYITRKFGRRGSFTPEQGDR